MSRHWREESRRPRTKLAELYGHPYIALFKGIVPLKSGFTPVTIGPNATAEQRQFADDVRWHQRKHNANFTAAELERIGAYAPTFEIDEDKVDPIPNIAVHPAFARKKWNPAIAMHLAEFPMGGHREGYWNAHNNDVVWEALLPCLRIATLYLTNAHLWPWFDALLSEEYVEIPKDEFPPPPGPEADAEAKANADQFEDRIWMRFLTRSPMVYGTQKAQQELSDKIIELSEGVNWKLDCSATSLEAGLAEEHGGHLHGETTYDLKLNLILVRVAFEPLECLLPENIKRMNIAETRMAQMTVAITILHEFCHAMLRRIIDLRVPELGDCELYFEDEVLQELGASMEQYVFGGLTVGINSVAGGVAWPEGAQISRDWVSVRDLSTLGATCPTLVNRPPVRELLFKLIQSAYIDWLRAPLAPIPIQWFLNAPSMNYFQNVIKKYGGKASKMGPKVVAQVELCNEKGDHFHNPRYPFKEFEGIPDKPISPMTDSSISSYQKTFERNLQIETVVRESRQRPSRKRKRGKSPSNLPPDESDSEVKSDDEMSETDDRDPLPCPRFHQISRYLIKRRRELALHTMCFKMPEHTLRAHILRRGELAITAYEWRAFLLLCENRHYLFNFTPEGRKHETCTYRGTIELHVASWPTTDLTPLPQPRANPKTDRWGQLYNFITLAGTMRQGKDPVWEYWFYWDHDSEEMRNGLNKVIGFSNELQNLDMPLCSKEEFEDTLWYLINVKNMFVAAPPGVIRRLPLSSPELVELGEGRFEMLDIPKGRTVVDWDGGKEYLKWWDEYEAEGHYEDVGITFANGVHLSRDEYNGMRQQAIQDGVEWPPNYLVDERDTSSGTGSEESAES